MTAIIFILLCIVLQVCTGDVINREVTRTIDASTAIVRTSTDIRIESDSKISEYILIFPNSQAEHLSHLSVSIKGKPEQLPVTAPVMNSNYTAYSVALDSSSFTLRVQVAFTGMLEPYPKEITQNEPQLVLLEDSHVFYSPYSTETQKTTVRLASSTVNSFTKRSPSAVKSSNLSLGPYKDVPAYEFSPMSVHFVNNKPFAKFSTMQREIEVSHWGNIAVEDIYELKHAGAVLKGGFSRFEYQARRGASTPSFRSLIASLPVQAHDIYYRDQIGNISTSELRMNKDDIELEVQARFPIFGGWQTQFYIGYSIPTESSLFIDASGRYNLKFDFSTMFQDVWVEDLEIKVVLPEGCTDIKVVAPYASEHTTSKRFTYLDSELNGGRPVIILKGHNLVEEHNEQVIVSYNFSTPRMLVEPMMLIVSFFVFFLLCSLVARMDGGATKEKKLA